jgi:hypothetical protein
MTVPAPAQAAPPIDPAVTPPVPTPPTKPAVEPAPQGASTDDLAKLRSDLDAANQRAEQFKAESRKHEDRWKTRDQEQAKTDATLKLIAEKAGIDLDGKPDPAKLAEQLTSAQQASRQASVELAVYRAAAAAGANADLLLDSRMFMAKAASLDPAATDFVDQVKAAAAQAVTANPTFAIAKPAVEPTPTLGPTSQPQIPAASGGDFSGAPGGQRPWTDADVEQATPQQLEKAIADGLLAHMGIAPPRKGRRHH